MNFKIDRNIPLPEKFLDNGYPFRKMKKGNSFMFSKTYSRKRMKQATSVHIRYSRKHGGLFTCAKYKGGIRIWKVK